MPTLTLEERVIQYMHMRGLAFLFSFPEKQPQPISRPVKFSEAPAKVSLAELVTPEVQDKKSSYIPLDYADSVSIGYGRRQAALEKLVEDLEEREWLRLNELGMEDDIHHPLQRYDCRDHCDPLADSFFSLFECR